MRRMGGAASGFGRKLSGVLARADRKLDKLRSNMAGATAGFGTVAAAGAAVVAAGGAALTASTRNAIEFQEQMGNVATIIDTNTESLDAMGEKVLEIGSRTPVPIGQISEALYDVRSAGISASEQFNVLEKSAQLGVAGLGSTKEAVDLVTSSINAFQLKGAEAEGVYDQIFRTVQSGKTTITGLSQGFGAVAGTVASTGTKLDEYLSSVAALTTTGAPAAQVHTQLKAVFAGLTRETKDTTKVFSKLGAQNLPDLIQQSGGFVPALHKIKKALGGDSAAILKLVGSTEALNAVLGLTGAQAEAQQKTLAGMRSGADAVGEAFEKQAGKPSATLQMMRNNVERLSIGIGNKLLPIVDKVATAISGWVKENGKLVADKVEAFIAAVSPLVEIFGDSFMATFDAVREGLASMFPPSDGDAQAWKDTLKVLAKNLGELMAVAAIAAVGVGAVIGGIVLTASAAWSALKGAGQAIVDFLGNIIFKVTDWWANLKALFNSEGMGLGDKMVAIGKHIVMGLVRGIKSLATAPFVALKNIALGALGGVKNALGIKSPSKEMAKLGAFTAQGFSLGINKEIPKVEASFARMALPSNDVAPQVSSSEGAVAQRLDNLVEMRTSGEVILRNQTNAKAEVRSGGGGLAIRVVSTGAA